VHRTNIQGVVVVCLPRTRTRDLSQNSRISCSVDTIAHAHEGPVCWIFNIKKIVLGRLPIDVLWELVNKREIIELHRDERKRSVHSIVVVGNVCDSHVSDDYGEDETNDRRQYLAAVSARLTLLEMQVFQDQGLYLVTAFGS